MGKNANNQEESCRNIIKAKKEELSAIGFNPDLFKKKEQEINEIENANQHVSIVQRAKAMCEFQFQSPYQQFDRQLVHGLIGKLFTIKDVEENGIAITQLLGGRVFNTVVVEGQEVGVQLLKNNQF